MTPVNEDDGQAEGDSAVATELKWSIARFILTTILTIPILVLAWSPAVKDQFILCGAVSLALASVVMFVGAGRILLSAFRAIVIDRRLDADVLIALSSLSAFIYSLIGYAYDVARNTRTLEVFFETSSLLVTLILLGRLVSTYARVAARRTSVSLAQPQADAAHLINEHGETADTHTALLDVNDMIIVNAGETIPSDGVVASGRSDVDEGVITGEAIPVTKAKGMIVHAGTVVIGPAALRIRLTKTLQDNSLSELGRLSREARSSRAPIQDVVDRLASWIIPISLTIAAISIVVWALVLKLVRSQSTGSAVTGGLSYAIAILALSCPCALALCVPFVMVYAGNVFKSHGILFKSAAAIQVARKTTHVIFDKTGTLTTGRMRVVEAIYETDVNRETSQALVAALVSGASHPVSAVVAGYLAETMNNTEAPLVELADLENVSGKGIQAVWQGSRIRGGSASWCQVQANPSVARMLRDGKSLFCVTRDGSLIAVFALEDDIRPECAEVFSVLLSLGIRISILSGDHQQAVDVVTKSLGVYDRADVEAKGNCSPDDKRNIVRMASWSDSCEQDKDGDVESDPPKSSWSKPSYVLFVGDGSNDTTALSQADVGVSFASGTALAINSADVVILTGGPRHVLEILSMSRKAWRRIVIGLTWALLYNALAIVFGSGILVKVRIAPQWAGLGELASIIPIIMISYSLRFF